MGMAASQARYLALVARKSNCEYQGQQINQARLNLANKTATLFNQMLGLNVPVPPSVQDFTKTQYSFTDGINASVIDKWEQLSRPDDDGNNYVVEYHYNANVYTGFQKKMNDPQVQFNISVPTSIKSYDEYEEIKKIYTAQTEVTKAENAYKEEEAKLTELKSRGKKLSSYRDLAGCTDITDCKFDKDALTYTLTGGNGKTYKAYSKLDGYTTDPDAVDENSEFGKVQKMLNAWKHSGIEYDPSELFFSVDDDEITFAYESDLENLKSSDIGRQSGVMSTLPLYHGGTENTVDPDSQKYSSVYGMAQAISQQTDKAQEKLNNLREKETVLETLNMPTFVGNTKLESLSELSQEEFAEIKQIIADMTANGADCNFTKCFKSSLNINPNDYSGGIYKFNRDGVTYYTTYYDLAETAYKSEFRNDIDNQPKLNYYHANYVEQQVSTTDKAILDTDSKGRFKSVRFASDGAQYTLNFEEKTDDAAYEDAMNKYYYENARYDKMIQDINAKTSIIQQEDRTLELKLKQLDTEQSALSNEIEAVQKVVKDNVEKSFKTFGG